MQTKLNPYISFKDTTRQAMEFYHSVFGGKLTLTTFNEAQAAPTPADGDLIMHAELDAGAGMILMASDTPAGMEFRPGTNIGISLSGDNDEELTAYFVKLSGHGTVTMPLEKAPWGDQFGMCTDAFGVSWMVNIAHQ